jgi:hypothetical protein
MRDTGGARVKVFESSPVRQLLTYTPGFCFARAKGKRGLNSDDPNRGRDRTDCGRGRSSGNVRRKLRRDGRVL